MRRLAILALLVCCTLAFAQKWRRDKGVPPQPATEAYFSHVGNIISKALGPELANIESGSGSSQSFIVH